MDEQQPADRTPRTVEQLGRFCRAEESDERAALAIQAFFPLSIWEQRAVLRDPVATMQLVHYHESQEIEADSIGFPSKGNQIRGAELKDHARRLVKEDPECWPEDLRRELGFSHSPAPITAASLAAKMRDLADDLAGVASPDAAPLKEALGHALARYDALTRGEQPPKRPDRLAELCSETRSLVAEYADVRSGDLLASMLTRAVEKAEAG
jgi:hypothetical protein